MEGEIGVTQGIIDELHSSDMQGNQVGGEICVTECIIDELDCWDIERD